MSSQPPIEILIAVRPRLFASALGRLLECDGRRVTVLDPEARSVVRLHYDVAVISDGSTTAVSGAAVIRLADLEQGHASGTLRIGSVHEIVPITSTVELVALIDRAGSAIREEATA